MSSFYSKVIIKDFNLNVVKLYKYFPIIMLMLFKISRNMDGKVLKYV